jgi:hypothetical protein
VLQGAQQPGPEGSAHHRHLGRDRVRERDWRSIRVDRFLRRRVHEAVGHGFLVVAADQQVAGSLEVEGGLGRRVHLHPPGRPRGGDVREAVHPTDLLDEVDLYSDVEARGRRDDVPPVFCRGHRHAEAEENALDRSVARSHAEDAADAMPAQVNGPNLRQVLW